MKDTESHANDLSGPKEPRKERDSRTMVSGTMVCTWMIGRLSKSA